MNRKIYLYVALIAVAAVAPYLLRPPEQEAAAAGSIASAQTASAQTGAAPSAAQDQAAHDTSSDDHIAAPKPVAPSKEALADAPVGRIETDELSVQVSALNGGLLSARLKHAQFSKSEKLSNLVTTDKPSYLPLRIELEGVADDARPFALEQLGEQGLRLQKTVDDVYIARKLEAGRGPYQLWLTTRLHNTSTSPKNLRLSVATYQYVPREHEGGKFLLLPAQSPAIASGVCRHDSELEIERRDALESALTFSGPIHFAGVANVFFMSAVAPENLQDAERCSIHAEDRFLVSGGEPHGSLFTSRLIHHAVDLQPGESRTYKTLAYLGPKSPDELLAAGHGLKEAIESGWFATVADGLTWLLREIHDLVGNWGLAIILLTILVKTALFPLTAKQMQSMAKMKELKPDLDRINELYGDDREKKGAAIMELYRKRGVNPMAGCFPVLLQLPIWFSLYASLSTNVELLHAPFALWWADLSSPDPYFVLPVMLGALMFVQQKMAPATSMDPMQQKMMLYMMPIMMTSFMLFLPAGLCLYTLTNSALSIGQQRLIEARLSRVASAPVGDASGNDAASDEPSTSSSSDSSTPSQRLRLNRPSKAERRAQRGKR